MSTEQLKFWSCNCRSLTHPRGAEVKREISESQLHFLFLQETGSATNLQVIEDYTLVGRYSRANKRGGGVAVYARVSIMDGISYKFVESGSIEALEYCAIEINAGELTIRAASVYLPPNLEENGIALWTIFSKQYDAYLGDFNAKSSLWSLKGENAAGATLEKILSETEYDIFSPTHVPTHVNLSRVGESEINSSEDLDDCTPMGATLDLVILGATLSLSLLESRMGKFVLPGSDHIPILTSFLLKVSMVRGPTRLSWVYGNVLLSVAQTKNSINSSIKNFNFYYLEKSNFVSLSCH